MTTETVKFKMNRKVKGSRTLFFPTINGKRLNNTNYARKYDAENLVKAFLKHYGAEKLNEMAAA